MHNLTRRANLRQRKIINYENYPINDQNKCWNRVELKGNKWPEQEKDNYWYLQ